MSLKGQGLIMIKINKKTFNLQNSTNRRHVLNVVKVKS